MIKTQSGPLKKCAKAGGRDEVLDMRLALLKGQVSVCKTPPVSHKIFITSVLRIEYPRERNCMTALIVNSTATASPLLWRQVDCHQSATACWPPLESAH